MTFRIIRFSPLLALVASVSLVSAQFADAAAPRPRDRDRSSEQAAGSHALTGGPFAGWTPFTIGFVTIDLLLFTTVFLRSLSSKGDRPNSP